MSDKSENKQTDSPSKDAFASACSVDKESSQKKEVLHPEVAITSLILIRHGDTKATERGLLYTDPKAELTEKGFEQARAAGNWLARHKPDALLSGTAKRVVDSASAIAELLQCDHKLLNGLSEWHVGDWEGRSYLDVKKNDPAMYAEWSSDPIRHRPPNGESIADLYERVNAQVEVLRADYTGRTVALVTHAGVIRAILVSSLGMPIDNFWRLAIPVGSISRVDLSDNFATVQFIGLKP